MKLDWNLLWESAKEPLRLLVLGVVSWALTSLVPTVPEVYAIPLTFILRFIDQLLHEYGKETKNDTLTLGLTRF